MDPERVRAYLQVACAGLGFDIGEVWWTQNEFGSSTVAAIEDTTASPHEEGALTVAGGAPKKKKYRFVQLYTSKSYENRRSELVNPPEGVDGRFQRGNSSEFTENLNQHVLSPQLVESISKTAQVVWANTKKQEGLIGKSEMRLQTAVGMPVAVDAQGNMCIVVMFSPNNIQSTADAMEYLQSISQSATSASIPCLLPVFDPNSSSMRHLPPSVSAQSVNDLPDTSSLGEGVTTRFVSFEHEGMDRMETSSPLEPEISEHELSTAPKDTFGIPMLPSFAELGGMIPEDDVDIFDEASYGIWSTIMESLNDGALDILESSQDFDLQRDLQNGDSSPLVEGAVSDPSLQVTLPYNAPMSQHRKERLEEFCNAFLGMSVFDLADVWVPAGGNYPDCLRHVMTVASTDTNELLNQFKSDSERTLIKFWSGAVGRAYSSGNPVWSASPNVFVDSGRVTAFRDARIMTVLAVPIFSGKSSLPSCVVSCYSPVQSGSVPFVLRFVQQALRLLWEGLDNIEPHESVGISLWEGVGPADLGEMAADVEMQQHFMSRKRPRGSFTASDETMRGPEESRAKRQSLHLQSVSLPSGETINIPLQLSDSVRQEAVPNIKVQQVQNHVYDAIRSVGDARPFDHGSSNARGTSYANMGPITGQAAQPLAPPSPLPTRVVAATNSSSARSQMMQPTQPVFQAPPQKVVPMSAPSMQLPTYSMQEQQRQEESLQSVVALASQSQLASSNNGTFQGNLMTPGVTQSATNVAGSVPQVTTSQFCMPTAASSVKCCRIQGCDEPAAARRPYCVAHSGNRLCEHPGCTKCAQGSTRFCIAHGGGRRCTYPGCDKGARDKFFCAAHGGGKRCKHEGCSKSAVGGSNLCTAHGGGRRCAVEGCNKSAQSSTKFCVKHGGGKKCAHDGCEKVARGRTQFCAAHGGGIRCKLDGCNRVAVGRLQLCRAHGGGSRKIQPETQPHSNLVRPPTTVSNDSMYMNNGMAPMMSFDHTTSV